MANGARNPPHGLRPFEAEPHGFASAKGRGNPDGLEALESPDPGAGTCCGTLCPYAWAMRAGARRRLILHVDLHPFFVSVERSLDPGLRGRPVIVGGESSDIVAAVSDEAYERGVRAGQPLTLARRLCPEAVFRAGDFETYVDFSEEVTAILLGTSRRVERPSVDEAYLDVTRDAPNAPAPVRLAERIRAQIEMRLGLEVSLGLASSRLAARRASASARPRGLLVVLPGYEESWLEGEPLGNLPALPMSVVRVLGRSGLHTLGDILRAPEGLLDGLLGAFAASHLRDRARGLREGPIALSAPPPRVEESAALDDPLLGGPGLREAAINLTKRVFRRLQPFGPWAGRITVEVRDATSVLRRERMLDRGQSDDAIVEAWVRELIEPLLVASRSPQSVKVSVSTVKRAGPGLPLFLRLRHLEHARTAAL